jgi:hypothetical protein
MLILAGNLGTFYLEKRRIRILITWLDRSLDGNLDIFYPVPGLLMQIERLDS